MNKTMKFKEIAEALDITPAEARAIYLKAIEKLEKRKGMSIMLAVQGYLKDEIEDRETTEYLNSLVDDVSERTEAWQTDWDAEYRDKEQE